MSMDSSPESVTSTVGCLANECMSLDVFKRPEPPKKKKKRRVLDEETYIHVSNLYIFCRLLNNIELCLIDIMCYIV